ncbi:MAG: hypothetical protein ACTSQE_06725 [Candidatus Heimdallarchaeaceae archaeon]
MKKEKKVEAWTIKYGNKVILVVSSEKPTVEKNPRTPLGVKWDYMVIDDSR